MFCVTLHILTVRYACSNDYHRATVTNSHRRELMPWKNQAHDFSVGYFPIFQWFQHSTILAPFFKFALNMAAGMGNAPHLTSGKFSRIVRNACMFYCSSLCVAIHDASVNFGSQFTCNGRLLLLEGASSVPEIVKSARQ